MSIISLVLYGNDVQYVTKWALAPKPYYICRSVFPKASISLYGMRKKSKQ